MAHEHILRIKQMKKLTAQDQEPFAGGAILATIGEARTTRDHPESCRREHHQHGGGQAVRACGQQRRGVSLGMVCAVPAL